MSACSSRSPGDEDGQKCSSPIYRAGESKFGAVVFIAELELGWWTASFVP